MTKTVRIGYWEKISVWQRVDAKCNVPDDFDLKNKENLRKAVRYYCDDNETDVEWETMDCLEDDFDTDLEIEELEVKA